jgi:hypothetical protein
VTIESLRHEPLERSNDTFISKCQLVLDHCVQHRVERRLVQLFTS